MKSASIFISACIILVFCCAATAQTCKGNSAACSANSSTVRPFAYTANSLDSTISVYSDNPSTGAIKNTSSASYYVPAYLVSLQPGHYLLGTGGQQAFSGFCEFAINTSTGALSRGYYPHCQGGVGNFQGMAGPMISDSSTSQGLGDYLYAVGTKTGSNPCCNPAIGGFKVSGNGALVPLAGSPWTNSAFPLGSGFGPMALDPALHFLYFFTSNGNGNFLSAVVRRSDGSLGSLAPGSPVNTGQCAPQDDAVLAIDPQGNNLFLNCGNIYTKNSYNAIQVYSINKTTGQLTLSYTHSMKTTPFRVAVDRSGWYVFAADIETNQVEALLFDRNTHTLTPVTGSPYATGRQPNTVAVDPTNQHVYVTNGGTCYPLQIANGNCTDNSSSNISGFQLHYKKGTATYLTPLPGQPYISGKGTRSMIFVMP